MRTFPFAPEPHLPAGEPLPLLAHTGHSDAYARRRAELLHGLGGPAAVLAAADKDKPAVAGVDDWSGSFDIHLGVYASD